MHKSSFLVKCRTIKLNDSPMLMAAGTQNAEHSRPSIARTSNVHTSRRRRLPPRNKNKKLLEIRASLLAHLILFCFCAQNGDAADSDQVDEDVNWCFDCVWMRENVLTIIFVFAETMLKWLRCAQERDGERIGEQSEGRIFGILPVVWIIELSDSI